MVLPHVLNHVFHRPLLLHVQPLERVLVVVPAVHHGCGCLMATSFL